MDPNLSLGILSDLLNRRRIQELELKSYGNPHLLPGQSDKFGSQQNAD